LPKVQQRLEFIESWNKSLEPDLRVSDSALPRIVDATTDFSYAYLKEMFVSSIMQWVSDRKMRTMDAIMLNRAAALRDQMNDTPGKKRKKREEKKKAKKAVASRL
ncbi:MAG TPA: hypothetical protein VKF81_15860, partial [Blastocatellia bacterium]|nr:hypothetical protein [Blastocatellia bacterium]